eukprot:gb/GECH01013103.1/.p1 GENE.gb/GECH01013103.1/~~gb/GECH01013103.1/.p1  ORF type:complete len:387 (+),score=91.30 gb/GECH01013103.1/:1-1161(+)
MSTDSTHSNHDPIRISSPVRQWMNRMSFQTSKVYNQLKELCNRAQHEYMPLQIQEIWGFGDFFLGNNTTGEACVVIRAVPTTVDGSLISDEFEQFIELFESSSISGVQGLRPYVNQIVYDYGEEIAAGFAIWSEGLSLIAPEQTPFTPESILAASIARRLSLIKVVHVWTADEAEEQETETDISVLFPTSHRVKIWSQDEPWIQSHLNRIIPEAPQYRSQEYQELTHHEQCFRFQRDRAVTVFQLLRKKPHERNQEEDELLRNRNNSKDSMAVENALETYFRWDPRFLYYPPVNIQTLPEHLCRPKQISDKRNEIITTARQIEIIWYAIRLAKSEYELSNRKLSKLMFMHYQEDAQHHSTLGDAMEHLGLKSYYDRYISRLKSSSS